MRGRSWLRDTYNIKARTFGEFYSKMLWIGDNAHILSPTVKRSAVKDTKEDHVQKSFSYLITHDIIPAVHKVVKTWQLLAKAQQKKRNSFSTGLTV